MKKGEAYSAIGGIFEYLNKDCGYDKWSQYLIEKLKSLGAGARGADVGCGNGYFTRALIKAGYCVTGIDISSAALSSATNLSLAEGVRAEFLLGDITKLKLGFKADFIVAVNDCLNYVPGDKLLTTFEKVNSNLARGGVFIFDISSESKLRGKIGNNLFSEDCDDYTYIWFNSLKEDRVEMDLTLFLKNADGSYTRSDERQTQYIHGETQVLSALSAAGFSAFSEGHIGGGKEERINFICKKL